MPFNYIVCIVWELQSNKSSACEWKVSLYGYIDEKNNTRWQDYLTPLGYESYVSAPT